MKCILNYQKSDFEEAAKMYLSTSRTMGRFSKFAWYYSLIYPKTSIVIGIVFFAATFFIFWFMVTCFLGWGIFALGAIIAGIFGGLGAQIIFNATLGKRNVLRNLQQQYAPSQSSEVTITESGISSKSRTGEGKLEWSAITRARYNHVCMILYLGEITNIILPKYFFTGDDWTRLIALVTSQVTDTEMTN